MNIQRVVSLLKSLVNATGIYILLKNAEDETCRAVKVLVFYGDLVCFHNPSEDEAPLERQLTGFIQVVQCLTLVGVAAAGFSRKRDR